MKKKKRSKSEKPVITLDSLVGDLVSQPNSITNRVTVPIISELVTLGLTDRLVEGLPAGLRRILRTRSSLFALRDDDQYQAFAIQYHGPTYNRKDFRQLQRAHPEIFRHRDQKQWSAAQTIDYAFTSPTSDKKYGLINHLADNHRSQSVLAYISAKRGTGELRRLRWQKDMRKFRGWSGKPIFQGFDFSARKDIFRNLPRWTMAEFIDYCFDGRLTSKRKDFMDEVREIDDTEVLQYLESKEGKGMLDRLRRQRDIEEFTDARGQPVYSHQSLHAVMRADSENFPDAPQWRVRHMLTHCLTTRQTLMAREFVESARYTRDQEVRSYIDGIVGTDQLTKLRHHDTILDFENEAGQPIYSMKGLHGVIRRNREMFDLTSWWKLQQMLDYCFEGKLTAEKRKFVMAALRLHDTGVNTYVVQKMNATYSPHAFSALDRVPNMSANYYIAVPILNGILDLDPVALRSASQASSTRALSRRSRVPVHLGELSLYLAITGRLQEARRLLRHYDSQVEKLQT